MEEFNGWLIYREDFVKRKTSKFYKCVCSKCGRLVYKDNHGLFKKKSKCVTCYKKRGIPDPIKGDRFGSLTVTGFIKKNKYGADTFQCFCDCGKEKWIVKYQLLNVRSKCSYACPIIIEPTLLIPGQTFGNWTVLEGHYRTKYARVFKCICICGNIKYQDICHLKSGDAIYCKDCPVKKEITAIKKGETFGFWTATGDFIYKKNTNTRLFEVICKCGFISFKMRSQVNKTNKCRECHIEYMKSYGRSF